MLRESSEISIVYLPACTHTRSRLNNNRPAMVQQANTHSTTQTEFPSDNGSKITYSFVKYRKFELHTLHNNPITVLVIASQLDFPHKPHKPQLQ